jgi:hypothetical protein
LDNEPPNASQHAHEGEKTDTCYGDEEERTVEHASEVESVGWKSEEVEREMVEEVGNEDVEGDMLEEEGVKAANDSEEDEGEVKNIENEGEDHQQEVNENSEENDDEEVRRGEDKVAEWALEDFHHQGRSLLLDSTSHLLYERNLSVTDGWPRLVGHVGDDGGVHLEAGRNACAAAMLAVCNKMEEEIRSRGGRVSQLFHRYGRDGDGRLRMEDLRRFLNDVLGDMLPRGELEVLYLQAMMGVNGEGAVTLEELRAALREVAEVVGRARVAEDGAREEEDTQVLEQLSTSLSDPKVGCLPFHPDSFSVRHDYGLSFPYSSMCRIVFELGKRSINSLPIASWASA